MNVFHRYNADLLTLYNIIPLAQESKICTIYQIFTIAFKVAKDIGFKNYTC